MCSLVMFGETHTTGCACHMSCQLSASISNEDGSNNVLVFQFFHITAAIRSCVLFRGCFVLGGLQRPSSFAEQWELSSIVARLRSLGKTENSSCFHPDSDDGYAMSNQLSRYVVEDVYKGEILVPSEIPLITDTDTGLQLGGLKFGGESFLGYLYPEDSCRDKEWNRVDSFPFEEQGVARPFIISECSLNKLWSDLTADEEAFLLLKGNNGTDVNNTETPYTMEPSLSPLASTSDVRSAVPSEGVNDTDSPPTPLPSSGYTALSQSSGISNMIWTAAKVFCLILVF